jgi:hypothetical protein
VEAQKPSLSIEDSTKTPAHAPVEPSQHEGDEVREIPPQSPTAAPKARTNRVSIKPIRTVSRPPLPAPNLRCRGNLNALGDAVRLAGVNLLARLRDGLEHLFVRQGGLSDDGRGLVLQRDLVALDA